MSERFRAGERLPPTLASASEASASTHLKLAPKVTLTRATIALSVYQEWSGSCQRRHLDTSGEDEAALEKRWAKECRTSA